MRDEFEYFGADVQTDGRSVIVGAPDMMVGRPSFTNAKHLRIAA